MSSSLPYPQLGPGFVRLILLPQSNFYLDIPLQKIRSLCLKPRKYLVFLGWCILGVKGALAERRDGPELDLDGDLEDGGILHYVKNGDSITDTTHAVELQPTRSESDLSSSSTDSRSGFRGDLLGRDGCCIFTQSTYTAGMHIIPFRRGTDGLRSIIANRPHDDETTDIPHDITITDIRNGILGSLVLHSAFDKKHLAILKTPNHVLEQTDIPQSAQRAEGLGEDLAYPTGERFTAQWLTDPAARDSSYIPNNTDAAFRMGSTELKPSALLLHYIYGEAAIAQWGHGAAILQKPDHFHGPATPASALMSPPRKQHDRKIVRRKLRMARDIGGSMGPNAGDDDLEVDSGEDLESLDASDLMFTIMMNSPYAKERRRKEDEAKNERLESWRQQLPSAPI